MMLGMDIVMVKVDMGMEDMDTVIMKEKMIIVIPLMEKRRAKTMSLQVEPR